MFSNDPNSPIYQSVYPQKEEDGKGSFTKSKYFRESVTDFAYDAAFKIAPNPRHFLSTARNGALLGRPLSGFKSAYNYGIQGTALFTVPFVAYSVASAPRGQKVSKGLGTTVGSLAGATIGGLLGGPLGAFVGGALLSGPIEKATGNTIDRLVGTANTYSKPDLGGRYQDSEKAYTMRQKAAQELGSSLLNARQHLGMEGMLMHG